MWDNFVFRIYIIWFLFFYLFLLLLLSPILHCTIYKNYMLDLFQNKRRNFTFTQKILNKQAGTANSSHQLCLFWTKFVKLFILKENERLLPHPPLRGYAQNHAQWFFNYHLKILCLTFSLLHKRGKLNLKLTARTF